MPHRARQSHRRVAVGRGPAHARHRWRRDDINNSMRHRTHTGPACTALCSHGASIPPFSHFSWGSRRVAANRIGDGVRATQVDRQPSGSADGDTRARNTREPRQRCRKSSVGRGVWCRRAFNVTSVRIDHSTNTWSSSLRPRSLSFSPSSNWRNSRANRTRLGHVRHVELAKRAPPAPQPSLYWREDVLVIAPIREDKNDRNRRAGQHLQHTHAPDEVLRKVWLAVCRPCVQVQAAIVELVRLNLGTYRRIVAFLDHLPSGRAHAQRTQASGKFLVGGLCGCGWLLE